MIAGCVAETDCDDVLFDADFRFTAASVAPGRGLPGVSPEAPHPRLRGRRHECESLDRVLANVRAGRSQVLVLRGEAGAGKTALLDYVAERAHGCAVARISGVASELELAVAGLHQSATPRIRLRRRRWNENRHPAGGLAAATAAPRAPGPPRGEGRPA
jgi:hypothetical protein